MNRIGKTFVRFGKSPEGNATVEFVLWFPVAVLVLGLVVDVSMMFHGQTQVLRIVQDANRNMSIGRFATPEATEAYIEDKLAGLSSHADAISTVTAGVVSTTVSYPASDTQFLGLFRQFNTLQLAVTADHLIEDWES